GEPHTGAGADLRAEHALGLLEAGSSGFVIGFGVQIRAADRVVDGGVVQIRGDLRVGDRHELEPRILDLEVDGGRHDGGDALRESASPCWIGHVVRSLLWPPAGGPSCGRDQSSGPYSLRLTDSRSSSGRWATSRSHLSSISPTCARSGATTATPTCARRYRSCSPVSAADTPNRRSSAITGRIADLFCLSECTSPSSRSSSSAPRYIRFSPRGHSGRPSGRLRAGRVGRPDTPVAANDESFTATGAGGSVARLLAQLVRLDHVADLDVGVGDRHTALEALADLGDVVLLASQRRDGDRLGDNVVVAEQTGLRV